MAVQVSSETPTVGVTQATTDTTAVQLSEIGAALFTSSFSAFVTDSLTVQASDVSLLIQGTMPVTDTIPLGCSEARALVFTTDTGALVVEGHDTTQVQAVDAINNLQVFVPGSTQNFVVTDSLKVQLNGSGQTPIAIAASDSVMVGLDEPVVQDGYFGVTDITTVQASEITSVNTGSVSAFFAVSDITTVGLA
jgi:hypothetical protein